jgi:hypothetical protein
MIAVSRTQKTEFGVQHSVAADSISELSEKAVGATAGCDLLIMKIQRSESKDRSLRQLLQGQVHPQKRMGGPKAARFTQGLS